MLTATEGLHALRTAAGFAPLGDVGWIAVTGDDRVRWLNGMVTNSVQALQPGGGAYTFLLNAQGRIQGDATVWSSGDDRLLLETDLAQVQPLMDLLDRFIIMDDVELQSLPHAWTGLRIAGPQAPDALQHLGLPATVGSLAVQVDVPWREYTLTVIAAHNPLVPNFEVWSSDAAAIAAVQAALAAEAVPAVSQDSFDLLRIVEGTPRYGVDIRDKDLPQETAQTRALHFNKGCYLGQEIVERIRSRGQVHRTFAHFRLTGNPPTPGTELLADGKPVGSLTSVAAEPVDGTLLALGFVRREALERRLPLTYTGGTATAQMEAPGANAASNA